MLITLAQRDVLRAVIIAPGGRYEAAFLAGDNRELLRLLLEGEGTLLFRDEDISTAELLEEISFADIEPGMETRLDTMLSVASLNFSIPRVRNQMNAVFVSGAATRTRLLARIQREQLYIEAILGIVLPAGITKRDLVYALKPLRFDRIQNADGSASLVDENGNIVGTIPAA